MLGLPSALGRPAACGLLLVGLGQSAAVSPAAVSSAAALEPSAQASAALPPDAIVGEWWTQEKDGRIEFSKTR
ncbi:MAG TPA: hypothetical protein VMG12_18325, partial [Polyangiaceae bacterium]|nr:hypothetical protein [Polyangiaceae bacterium]